MNWSKLIADLEDAGLTQQEIADACNCSQPYISQLKAGERTGVGFEVGSALKELHERRVAVMQKGRTKDRTGARAP